jgi:hypothetical protein
VRIPNGKEKLTSFIFILQTFPYFTRCFICEEGNNGTGEKFRPIRLEERFIRTMETLIRQPGASIWEVSEDRVEAEAIYRIPANERFDREEILRAHREAMIRRIVDYGVRSWRYRIPHPPEDAKLDPQNRTIQRIRFLKSAPDGFNSGRPIAGNSFGAARPADII